MDFKKLYFWLVSLISIVAMWISAWVALSSIGKMIFISSDEYLATNSYKLNTCDYEVKNQLCGGRFDVNCKYSTSEYEKLLNQCKQKKKEEILLQRQYNLKLNLIGSISTFVVFLVIFVFHYFKFSRISRW